MNTIAHPELALGTVQFGMPYGIVGRGSAVPFSEVEKILDGAWNLGIRVIDTAPGYGNIENNLASLFRVHAFRVVSKISVLPPHLSKNEVGRFVIHSILNSKKRLGNLLDTLLFHSCDDLLGKWGELIWRTASDTIQNTGIRLGVSCYSPQEVANVSACYPISVAQIPGNAFDQRLRIMKNVDDVEIHLRSVFLQGILLSTVDEVSNKLPQALSAVQVWLKWCSEKNLKPLEAALGVVKGLAGVRYCVIGVASLSQFEEIVACWSKVSPLNYPYKNDLLEIIDPRHWST